MEDIFSGPGRSEEMDSLLFKKSDNPDCTLRLCALQKLTVCSQNYKCSDSVPMKCYLKTKQSQSLQKKVCIINVKKYIFCLSQESLVIKVDLHYTHMSSKLRQTESQQVDIGKPLVASCKLYKRSHSTTAKKQKEDASAQSMGNISRGKPLLHQTLAGPCRPFTRKAECAAKVAVTRSNEPEENDETELQDFTFQY